MNRNRKKKCVESSASEKKKHLRIRIYTRKDQQKTMGNVVGHFEEMKFSSPSFPLGYVLQSLYTYTIIAKNSKKKKKSKWNREKRKKKEKAL